MFVFCLSSRRLMMASGASSLMVGLGKASHWSSISGIMSRL